MNDSKASKAQNLARIRDNQRRSRARRKEYLQELETKLRSCEQRGVEASAEIQSAARRVLDENRKLRTLLHERGVSDADIIVAIGGPSDRPYDHLSATSALSAMLDRRITCAGPSCTSSPVSTHSSIVGLPPHTSAVPPLSIPVPRSTAMNNNDSPSPHSIVSGIDTPPTYHGTAFYRSPITPAPDIKTENIQPYLAYDQSFNNSWAYQGETQYVADSTGYYNTSACVDAANIIRTMRSGVEDELENDVSGQQCYVNNSVMFNVNGQVRKSAARVR